MRCETGNILRLVCGGGDVSVYKIKCTRILKGQTRAPNLLQLEL